MGSQKSWSLGFFSDTGGDGITGGWNQDGDRVRWVRSTQTTCSSAAGAGPAVTPPDSLHMDSDGIDSSDSEVSSHSLFQKLICKEQPNVSNSPVAVLGAVEFEL